MDFSKTLGKIIMSIAHFWKGNLKLVLIKVTKMMLKVRLTLIPLIDLDLSWVAKAIENTSTANCR